MNVLIRTVRHSQQPYVTVGSWRIDDDSLSILVSKVGDSDEEFLIGLHELIEAYLCHKHDISHDAVIDYDTEFNDSGKKGEPGDQPDAPYHREHVYATNIERLVAGELRVNWADHGDVGSKL